METGDGTTGPLFHLKQKPAVSSTTPTLSDDGTHAEVVSHKNAWRGRRVASAVAGLFVFYVAHDYLQERTFHRPGFSFGWAMTSVEIGTMFACAWLCESSPGGLFGSRRRSHVLHRSDDEPTTTTKAAVPPPKALAPPARRYLLLLVCFIAVSQGTGSAALAYVRYPLKVAFKSAKLVPTMLFSRCLTDARYQASEYAAAVLMCVALTALGLADHRTTVVSATTTKAALRTAGTHTQTRAGHAFGLALLTAATCSDSLIPNVQEKLLRQLSVPISNMVILSNLGSFVLVFVFIVFNGELQAFLAYCRNDPAVAPLLAAQALAAYCGLRCYLYVIRSLSGVAGVLTTSARKVVTIVLSFLLFKKPFTFTHAVALAVLAAGVGLTILAKHRRVAHAGPLIPGTTTLASSSQTTTTTTTTTTRR